MEHVTPVPFSPLLPTVFLYVSDLYLTMLIHTLEVGNTRAVLVNTNKVFHSVFDIDRSYLPINPVDLTFLVSVIFRFGTIVLKPGKLGRVEEGTENKIKLGEDKS